jgi:hypothetical protein
METTKQSSPKAKAKRAEQDMAVIIRNLPPTYNWGWFSREDQRMHVQIVDRVHLHLNYKIWLERQGRRVIEPEPGIPSKVFKALQAVIVKERVRIDQEWAAFMIQNGWLKARMTGTMITLYAYPNSPNHFERTIDVRELILSDEYALKVTPKDVALNQEFAFLELFPQKDEAKRVHEPLHKILWID